MLTKLTVRNFKRFEAVEVELGNPVVFIGPNNSGKTTALQALAFWDIGLKRWNEKRKGKTSPEKRPGVTINRRDLVAVPVPDAKLFWRGLAVRDVRKLSGKQDTKNVFIDIIVEGITADKTWKCGLEFYYANEESFYCRPLRLSEEKNPERMPVPEQADNLKLAFLPPMSGLAANENRLDPKLDLSSSGKGLQQTLLLLAYMYVHPGAVLLLDEPDAHLEILRQRHIYQLLTDVAQKNSNQIIAASHSEVLLNEAAQRDVVIAFVGRPHRINDKGSQVSKALKDIGFEHYYQAEQTGWVLYLEGSTDLAILREFAEKLEYQEAIEALQRPFVHYVSNQPPEVRKHFFGLREAVPSLKGIAIFDRLPHVPSEDMGAQLCMWRRREIENYLCYPEVLDAYAAASGTESLPGPLFEAAHTDSRRRAMRKTIVEMIDALDTLGKGSPWDGDMKVSDDFLIPLFRKFFRKLGHYNVMDKKSFHELARFVPKDLIDPEVKEKLDTIVSVARSARPRTD
ncbi:MAG: hypothetical protein B1H13_06535 [Desulfobacteraceae bacterium 4484_190.3]|nr:MAG: hypothetical protein B1H13_06535 [Desulfobacteraceae bacterium 4484_190.3]